MDVRLVWWNLQDFTHYDPSRAGESQWPASQAAFNAKLDLVASVLSSIVEEQPVVLALAETTRHAAEKLRDRVVPGYRVLSLDLLDRSDLNVAIIYPPLDLFEVRPPFIPNYVPLGTRAMGVLDICSPGHTVRIIACHWTARFRPTSDKVRSDTARELSRFIFSYLEAEAIESRHVVILGDLNEEPFGLLERDLYAQRERHRSQRRHWSDKAPQRRYLYNISWRLLGERASDPTSSNQSAGTYYWADEAEWRTFDHIIVDGSLVTGARPSIDESSTAVLTHDLIFRAGRTPAKYWWDGTAATGGVSDHLPLTSLLSLGDQ